MAQIPFEQVRQSFENGKLQILKKYFNYIDDEHVRMIKLNRKKEMHEYTTVTKIHIYVPKIDFVNSAKDIVLEFHTDKEDHRKSNGDDVIGMLERLADNFEPSSEE